MSESEFVISDEYDGHKRKLYKKNCVICNEEFLCPKYRNKKACSITCKGKFQQIRLEQKCAHCNRNFTRNPSKLKNSKSGLQFCSRKCKDTAQSFEGNAEEIRPAHYKNGEFSYRERALKAYPNKCVKCRYDQDLKMLEVDHIDSDRRNNKLFNLQILCVWCHWLKTRKVNPHNWSGNLEKLNDVD